MIHLTLAQKKALGLAGLILLIGFLFVANTLHGIGDNTGYAPEQPIPFSHKLHAGDNEIPCQYCHTGVDKGKHATIPSANVCMNCHKVVKTDSPHIKKLTEKYNNNEAIEWIKVHDIPDHAFFNHRPHIEAGFDCSSCHGNVAEMEKVQQVETLMMGFCINCHRDNGGPQDCYTCHH